MADPYRLARTLLAVVVGTFAAGALVNVRLRAVTALEMDWAAVALQGLEVAAVFSLLVVPSALAGWLLARRLRRGRLVVGLLTYAVAFALLVLAYGRSAPLDVALDGYAHLYLAAGSLGVALAGPPATARPAAVATAASPA